MSAIPAHLQNMHAQFTSQPCAATAKHIVAEFFSYIDPARVQEQLWELTHGTITNSLLDTQTAMHRHNLLYFYEYGRLFIEAVYYLHREGAKAG